LPTIIIEILIVVSIIGILVSVVLPSFSKMKADQALKNSVEDIISTMDKARSQTLSSLNASSYGLHFQSDKVIIFTGVTFNAQSSSNEIVNTTSPVTITNVTLGGSSGTTGDIYFNRLNGSPSKTGTNTITVANSSTSKIITILPTGIISVN